MKRLALIALVALVCAVPALADDAFITTSFTGVGLSAAYSAEHGDLEPFKGSALVTVTNSGNEAWSDFHFQVFSVGGSNISATIFVDGGAYNPTSSQSGLGWTINNSPSGSSMDLVFSDFVMPGETAWFKVYTDNTTYKQRFGLMVYPTTDYVPEPSSIVALSGSLLGLAGLALKKRS